MENRDAQITLTCIAFFVLALQAYFYVAAGNADGTLSGGVADYQVNSETAYVFLDAGSESIADGDTLSMMFNTDAVDIPDQHIIVGLRLNLSYTEDEAQSGCWLHRRCRTDTITGTASHDIYNATGEGQNSGGSGEHGSGRVVQRLVLGRSRKQIGGRDRGWTQLGCRRWRPHGRSALRQQPVTNRSQRAQGRMEAKKSPTTLNWCC